MSRMTEEAFDAICDQAARGNTPWGEMQNLATAVLLDAATGKLDLALVARAILTCRGLDPEGKYIGYREARQVWRAKSHPGYAALGRRGGATISEKRLASNRANAKKGGRPRKTKEEEEQQK